MLSVIFFLQKAVAESKSFWISLLEIPNLIAGVSALAAIVSAVIAIWPSLRQWWVNRLLARSFGSDFYSPEVLERSTRYYVPPNCTSIDPSYESEMRNLVATEEPLFGILDRFLDRSSKHRHLILLADSGMGKSSCLLNYYVRNQRRPLRKRKRISIIPLGIPEADKHIQVIDNKRDTFLFLDAFDEDTKAIQDYKERLRHLMDLASEFSRVLITCRTQFFLRDEEIPRETGIVRFEPRSAGEKGVYEFQKLYLAPLDDRQVAKFLKKRYPLWHLPKRRRARKLVDAVPLLSVRPMLLAYIPDLLESGIPIQHAFELYESLTDSWLERESRWVKAQSLRRLSEHLAVDLYCNRERRGAERISVLELSQLATQWDIPLENWQLTGRSLLNRDASGNYKFAHRSIMEYLFVRRYLADDRSTGRTVWTDQMISFLNEIMRFEYFRVDLAEKPPISNVNVRLTARFFNADISGSGHPKITLLITALNTNDFLIFLESVSVREEYARPLFTSRRLTRPLPSQEEIKLDITLNSSNRNAKTSAISPLFQVTFYTPFGPAWAIYQDSSLYLP